MDKFKAVGTFLLNAQTLYHIHNGEEEIRMIIRDAGCVSLNVEQFTTFLNSFGNFPTMLMDEKICYMIDLLHNKNVNLICSNNGVFTYSLINSQKFDIDTKNCVLIKHNKPNVIPVVFNIEFKFDIKSLSDKSDKEVYIYNDEYGCAIEKEKLKNANSMIGGVVNIFGCSSEYIVRFKSIDYNYDECCDLPMKWLKERE